MGLSLKSMIFGYLFYNMPSDYLFYFIFYFLKIKKYIIKGDKELNNDIIKKIKDNIFYTEIVNINGKNYPSGFFIGYKYYGYIEFKDSITITLYTTSIHYHNLINEIDNNVPIKEIKENKTESVIDNINTYKPDKKIVVYIRKGSYKNFYYNSMKLDLSHIKPIGKQEEIIESIMNIYNKKGRASIFINGVSGAGKSTIGYLLAKQLNGIYCHSFNPTDPGDYLSTLISDIQLDEPIPIIIVIEEIDILLKKIHIGIQNNNEMPIPVYNKCTWNTFMDDLIFYKILFVFTSNTSKENIDKMDPAYLRKGRIDEYYYMNEAITL